MKRKFTKITLSAIAIASALTLTSCGSWWATTSVGPDLYFDDYYPSGGYYPGYVNPGYYPGYIGPVNTPPPPAGQPNPGPGFNPGGNPGGVPGGNPGGINGGNNGGIGPSSRPPGNNAGGVGSPSQGGYRGEQNGSNSRH